MSSFAIAKCSFFLVGHCKWLGVKKLADFVDTVILSG